jgi:hypothetical protein
MMAGALEPDDPLLSDFDGVVLFDEAVPEAVPPADGRGEP